MRLEITKSQRHCHACGDPIPKKTICFNTETGYYHSGENICSACLRKFADRIDSLNTLPRKERIRYMQLLGERRW